MIGRETEKAALGAACDAAVAGTPQLVLITGPPGIGRTTLLETLAGLAGGARIVRVRCFPVGRLAAFGTLGDLLAALLGVPDAAPRREVERALRAKVRPFPDPERYLALLGRIFGLDLPHRGVASLGPVALAQTLFAAVDDVLRADAAGGPVVLAIDDVHWGDQGSIAWIESLGVRLARGGGRLLVACTALEASVELPAGAPITRLALDPLPMKHAVEIASLWLGVKVAALPPAVRTVVKRVLDRAGGNPGYLQATLAALADTGTLVRRDGTWAAAPDSADVTLPAWIEAALATRLAQLPVTLAEKLRLAAVMGPTVDPAVMRKLVHEDVGEAIGELLRMRLLVEAGEGQVQFASEAVRDSAYRATAASLRQKLHAQVGEAVEALAGEAPGRVVVDLARHFAEAGDAPRAYRYLVQSGDRSRESNLPGQARQAYLEALEWAARLGSPPKDAPDAAAVLLDLATVEIQLGNPDAALEALARIRRRSPAAARTLALARERKGLLQEALDACLDAQRLAKGDPLERARSLAAAADIHRRMGKFDQAIRLADEAMELYAQSDYPAEVARVHGVSGLCYHRLGDWEQALAQHGQALRIREEAGDLEGTANSLNNLAMIEAAIGRLDEAAADCGKAFELFCKIGNRPGAAMTLTNLGDFQLKKGDDVRAERHLREALAMAEQMGYLTEQITAGANLAEVYLRRGNTQAALKLLEHSAALAVRIGQREFLPEIHAGRAVTYMKDGDRRAAKRAFLEARDAARVTGNHAFVERMEEALAKLGG